MKNWVIDMNNYIAVLPDSVMLEILLERYNISKTQMDALLKDFDIYICEKERPKNKKSYGSLGGPY